MSSPCRKLPTNCNHILLEEDDPFLVGITIDVKTLECITVMTPLQKQTTKTKTSQKRQKKDCDQQWEFHA